MAELLDISGKEKKTLPSTLVAYSFLECPKFHPTLRGSQTHTIGAEFSQTRYYSVSRLDEIQIRANNRLPLQSSQTQTVFNSTENRYI
jgi:hypothetical protein